MQANSSPLITRNGVVSKVSCPHPRFKCSNLRLFVVILMRGVFIKKIMHLKITAWLTLAPAKHNVILFIITIMVNYVWLEFR